MEDIQEEVTYIVSSMEAEFRSNFPTVQFSPVHAAWLSSDGSRDM